MVMKYNTFIIITLPYTGENWLVKIDIGEKWVDSLITKVPIK